MQRTLASLLLLAFTWPLLTAATPYDVENTPYEAAYQALMERGIVQDGRPYQSLNRAEALKVILESEPRFRSRVAQFRRNMPRLALFKDIDQKAWYAPYIEAAFAEGLITGYPDKTIRPGNTLTVEEAVALMLRADRPLSSVSSRPNANWYTGYIAEADQKNLFPAGEQLYLGEQITRGQFFTLVHRAITVKEMRLTAFEGDRGLVPVVRALAWNPTNPVPQNPFPPNPQPSVPRPSTPATPAPSNPTTNYYAISAPSIGINDLRISRPSDPFTSKGILEPLKTGVGNLFSYPGAGSKILIYGHSSGYSWDVSSYTKIFRGINKLGIGDKVYVNYHGTVYTYEVTKHRTIPAADTTFIQGEGEELVLYTCWPPDSIKERYLVYAKPVAN